MAGPVFQNEGELYIHAARSAVWAALTRLEEWPQWNGEILAASWAEGPPWQEGSIFELRHRREVAGQLLSYTTSTRAVLRMLSPLSTAVWESETAGMQVVNSANLRDDRGGCLLTARHAYHGAGAYALRLLAPRLQAKLDQAMLALKEHVEGQPRR